MSRSCLACGFTAKNHGSLARHVDNCLFTLGVKRRIRPRPEAYLDEDEISRIRDAILQRPFLPLPSHPDRLGLASWQPLLLFTCCLLYLILLS